ncbi:MAG: recombinase family protein, partial [Leptospiraceae bacterium]|nr:recombinase family protein [Leptospiraceae bacterium]
MNEILSIETAVIINRVSSEEQSEGYSLEAQDIGNQEYAKRKGIRVAKAFFLSESARGVQVRREFQEAIDYAIKNKVPHIIVEKVDRLLRNVEDLVWIKKLIEKHILTFHFRKESIIFNRSSNSHERFNIGIKSLVGEFYSDNNGEEIAKGKKVQAEKGQPPTRIFGYRWIDRRLVPHETQAEHYKLLVELYFKHKSVVEVADQMNIRGIIAPRGGRWNHQTVNQILIHPMHSGYFRFKGKIYKGSYEPLISEEKWHTMQTMIAANTSPKTQRQWLLSGLLRHVNG